MVLSLIRKQILGIKLNKKKFIIIVNFFFCLLILLKFNFLLRENLKFVKN